MSTTTVLHTSQLENRLQHWMHATDRLSRLENMASTFAWNGVDGEVRKAIIETLNTSLGQVKAAGNEVNLLAGAGSPHPRTRNALLHFRQQYLNTETTVHFFTDALNSRTNASIASLLRACDLLCSRSMHLVLPRLGRPVPLCFTYLDRGLGASILKSGIRLWDGSFSPVAAIKITFHNLYRPTAVIHETGHQVAHITGWSTELAAQLKQRLNDLNPRVADAYASWASEIAADNFAFVHTGYAAVASLYNVLAGTATSIFTYHEGDPHPIGFLRALINIGCCRKFYGAGPWDDLEQSMRNDYPLTDSMPTAPLIRACERVSDIVNDVCLTAKFNAFGGKALTELVDPMHVSPLALGQFDQTAGSLQSSHAWVFRECLRMLALSGYKIATLRQNLKDEYKKQEEWMMQLGISTNQN